MNDLTTLIPDKKFKWKTQTDLYLYPYQMTTQHLFFTIRMIWNHSAPEHLKLLPYKKYNFGDFYTSKYIINAIRNILAELITRTDIKNEWKEQINFMFNQINNLNIKLIEN